MSGVTINIIRSHNKKIKLIILSKKIYNLTRLNEVFSLHRIINK